MLLIINLGVILYALFGVITIPYANDKIGRGFGITVSIICLIISIIINFILLGKPEAIDVYRNKTELEIHSVNGVPTDSVVVWKGDINE